MALGLVACSSGVDTGGGEGNEGAHSESGSERAVTGTAETTTLGENRLVYGDDTAFGSKRGITLTWETLPHEGVDVTSLGAWMEHSSFSLDRA